jgi:LysM repeat protein
MTMCSTRSLALLGLSAMLALSACSNGPAPKTLPAPTAPVASSEIDAVQAMLLRGDRKGADKTLKTLLKRQPMQAQLLLLRDSIDGDPKELLGPSSYPYTVRPGDTIEELAERLLGNRLKAYQLARYNGFNGAIVLTPGSVLKIPGSPPRPRPQPAPVAERPSRPAPAAPAVRPKPSAPAPAAAPPAAAAAKPTANPAGAQRARAAGLAALNRGAVREAVGMLQRAQSLDPGNALIARDLQRAQRIAATVRARK